MYAQPRREKAGKHLLTNTITPAYHGGMDLKMALPTAAAPLVTQAILQVLCYLPPRTANGSQGAGRDCMAS